jgi:hypothetical protein
MNLNAAQLLGIISPIAAAVAALSVGYMHRKQMRQNEARRLVPTLPVKPPALPIWGWLVKYAHSS